MAIQLGPHTLEVEGDCVVVRLVGSFSLEHMKEFCAVTDKVIADHGHALTMSDFSRGGEFPPDSRRYGGQWPNAGKVWAAALFGGSVAQRVIINMITAVTRIFQKEAGLVGSFATEAEARAWLTEVRRRKQAVLERSR